MTRRKYPRGKPARPPRMESLTNPLKRHLQHQRVAGPRLGVDWEPRRGHWLSDLRAALVKFNGDGRPRFFSDSWSVQRALKRAFTASLLVHAAVMIFPWTMFDSLRATPRPRRMGPNVQLTWYDPTPRDLPAIAPRKSAPAPAKAAAPKAPEPPKVDAFHPRQTIASTPLKPNHPRQTLIQPDAPPEAPKILPQLPNIVEWAASTPNRPRLQISRRDLAKLRPRQVRRVPAAEMVVPDAPNMELRAGELNIASSTAANPRPAMPMVPQSVPVAGPREVGDAAMAAPDVPAAGPSGSGVRSIVALSATPAPPAPNIEIPLGNTAAQFLISPEGPRPGGSPAAGSGNGNGNGGTHTGDGGGSGSASGTGSGGSGAGAGPPGVSISPSRETTSTVAGPAAPAGVLPTRPIPKSSGKSSRIMPGTRSPRAGDAPALPTTGGALENYNPSAPPEAVLGPKRIYTLHVNMPNLTSFTGSWVLRFAELDGQANQGASRALPQDLSTPVPVSKVDPRYPPALRDARVEGDVVLYAIIRKDGSVDSVQVLRSVEPQLDRNAMDALLQWKFRPADRAGTPVDLEAVITIPFRIPVRTPF